MEFDRKTVLSTLDVVKLAVDTQDFVPVLSHFCFDGRNVTAYNDFIAIRAKLRTSFSLALKASTLLSLLGSIGADKISLGQSKKTVFLKSGNPRVGVRARLPYISPEDFIFKWPKPSKRSIEDLSEKTAAQFFKALQLCLVSVGQQNPNQMGITLDKRKDRLYFYSTNNSAISRYHMPFEKSSEDMSNVVFSTQFCQGLLKAYAAYGDQGVSFSITKGYCIFFFGEECAVYGKLVNNPDPYDFEDIISKHTKNWRKKRQKVPPNFAEIFDRSLLVLQRDLQKLVSLEVLGNTVSVEASSSLGKVKSSAVFPKTFLDDKTLSIDAEFAAKAASSCEQVFFGEGAVVFSKGNYTHLVSTHAG